MPIACLCVQSRRCRTPGARLSPLYALLRPWSHSTILRHERRMAGSAARSPATRETVRLDGPGPWAVRGELVRLARQPSLRGSNEHVTHTPPLCAHMLLVLRGPVASVRFYRYDGALHEWLVL